MRNLRCIVEVRIGLCASRRHSVCTARSGYYPHACHGQDFNRGVIVDRIIAKERGDLH